MTLLMFANLVCQDVSPTCRIIVWYVGSRCACTHTARELRNSSTAKDWFIDDISVLSENAVFCKVSR